MTDRDEQLRKALEAAQKCDVSSVEAEFAKIGLSPLGELIERILPSLPSGQLRTVAERLRDLKQGEFEDLLDNEFQSFLVSYLRIDAAVLQRVIQILRTHHAVYNSEVDVQDVAARGADVGSITVAELEDILSRRQYIE